MLINLTPQMLRDKEVLKELSRFGIFYDRRRKFYIECKRCEGKGYILRDGLFNAFAVDCPHCKLDGTGGYRLPAIKKNLLAKVIVKYFDTKEAATYNERAANKHRIYRRLLYRAGGAAY